MAGIGLNDLDYPTTAVYPVQERGSSENSGRLGTKVAGVKLLFYHSLSARLEKLYILYISRAFFSVGIFTIVLANPFSCNQGFNFNMLFTALLFLVSATNAAIVSKRQTLTGSQVCQDIAGNITGEVYYSLSINFASDIEHVSQQESKRCPIRGFLGAFVLEIFQVKQ